MMPVRSCRGSGTGRSAVLGLAGALALSAATLSAEEAKPEALARGYSEFGLKLAAKLAGTRGNVLVSPVSVGLALDMLRSGSAGQTRTELLKLLGGDGLDEAARTAAIRALIALVTAGPAPADKPDAAKVAAAPDPRAVPPSDTPGDKAPADADKAEKPDQAEAAKPDAAGKPTDVQANPPPGKPQAVPPLAPAAPIAPPQPPAEAAETRQPAPEIAIANALFFRKGAARPEFQESLRGDFSAALFDKLDLGAINGFVKDKTRGRIPEILKSLKDDSVAVVLNAVYFAGSWAQPFPAAATKPAPFLLAKGKPVDLPMMRRTGDVAVVDGKDFSAARLPYAGGSVAMIVVRPVAEDGLAKVASALDAPAFARLIADLRAARPVPTDIGLPKFNAEGNVDLVRPLKALGLKHVLCSARADFSAMLAPSAQKGPACIDKVAHRVTIEVGETGSVAAAATAARISVRSFQRPVPTRPFVVDRPFLFAIVDEATGAVLFLGRIVDPRAKTS